MKAVVWHGPGQISLDEVPDPRIQDPGDAIVRLTMSAICGTDLHMIRGTFPGMSDGRVLGHEGVGVVEEVGPQVRAFRPGDRVVVPSTLCCGSCAYCRAGYTSQCDCANPHGPLAGTAILGGPDPAGGFDGMQAGFVRIPWAGANLIPVPYEVIDEQAIICSDVFPTGWYGARLAEVGRGDTVAVLGCGPVGQLAIASAWKLGAGRVLAVDQVPDRLDQARAQHAEPVDFSTEDPVEVLRELTNGVGPDRVVDAVGVDAYPPPSGQTSEDEQTRASQGGELTWHHGTRPSQAARLAVEAVAKAGTIGVAGVYPPGFDAFPIGSAMNGRRSWPPRSGRRRSDDATRCAANASPSRPSCGPATWWRDARPVARPPRAAAGGAHRVVRQHPRPARGWPPCPGWVTSRCPTIPRSSPARSWSSSRTRSSDRAPPVSSCGCSTPTAGVREPAAGASHHKSTEGGQ